MANAVPAGYESSDEDDYEGDIMFSSGLRTVEKRSNVNSTKNDLNITTDPIDWQSAIGGSIDGSGSKSFNKSLIGHNRTQDITLHSACSNFNETLMPDGSSPGNLQNLADSSFSGYNNHRQSFGGHQFYEDSDGNENDMSTREQQEVPENTTAVSRSFSDLDLFLLSISEDGLIDIFEKHEVTFKQLLCFEEQDLINIGINKVGLRKKIIDGIAQLHSKSWKPTSLDDLSDKKKLLTAPGIYIVLGDITKHIDYIGVTLAYLQNQIENNHEILELGKDYISVEKILEEMENMSKTTKITFKNMGKLKNCIEDLKQGANGTAFQPANLIDLNRIKSSMSLKTKGPINMKVKILSGFISVFALYKLSTITIKYIFQSHS